MRVVVGSQNACKLQSTREVLADYPKFAGAEIIGVEVDSGVGEQPMNLDATIAGAINRAKTAFQDCNFSIGIEGGTVEVPQTDSGAVKIDVCAIFNGEKIGLGFSMGYVVPADLHKLMLEKGLHLSEAARVAGYTDHPKIGTEGGVIGLLTDGRMTRVDMCRQALITALIHFK